MMLVHTSLAWNLDEKSMLERIRQHLVPPSRNASQLRQPTRRFFSQFRQDEYFWRLFDRPFVLPRGSQGFFVESGAFDGEWLSNTLALERERGWTGLLIEPDPANQKVLLSKQRNAWIFRGGLSTAKSEDSLVRFRLDRTPNTTAGGLSALDMIKKGKRGGMLRGHRYEYENAYVAPLDAILRAIDVHTVDFWSIDIEGAEAMVLDATDFGRIEVGLIEIETDQTARVEQILGRAHGCNFSKVGMWDGQEGDAFYINRSYFATRHVDTVAVVAQNSTPREYLVGLDSSSRGTAHGSSAHGLHVHGA